MGFWREYAEYVTRYSIAGVLLGSIWPATVDAWRAPRGLTCETLVRSMRCNASLWTRYWGVPTMLYSILLVTEIGYVREEYEQKQGKQEGSEAPQLG